MMNRSKQEWIDYVWNPLTGCNEDCDYCYELYTSKRFASDIRYNKGRKDTYTMKDGIYILDEKFVNTTGGTLNFPFGFEPTYHKYREKALEYRKRTANILVCSDGELFGPWVPDWIIEDVFNTCMRYPNHNYLFLTRYPQRYYELLEKDMLPDKSNMWYGTSVITSKMPFFDTSDRNTFIAIEPIMACFGNDFLDNSSIKWVVIGADRRKYGVPPEFKWISGILETCKKANIPVYIVDSMRPYIPADVVKKDYPSALLEKEIGAALKRKLYGKCNWCKKEFRKNEMITLLGRVKRGTQPKQFGFICYECFEIMADENEIAIPSELKRKGEDDGKNKEL